MSMSDRRFYIPYELQSMKLTGQQQIYISILAQSAITPQKWLLKRLRPELGGWSLIFPHGHAQIRLPVGLPTPLYYEPALTLASRSLTQSTSRPQTPSSGTKSNGRAAQSASRTASTVTSPASRPSYNSYLSPTKDDWATDDADYDEEEEDRLNNIYDDAQEDEFGLPSLTTPRRNAKRIPNDISYDPGGTLKISPPPNGRNRANSSDIAEERGPPIYPTAKQSEGKILRPQYKEILRGRFDKPQTMSGTKAGCQIPQMLSISLVTLH